MLMLKRVIALSLYVTIDDVVEAHATVYIHRTTVMLSLHVATASMQLRRFDHEGLVNSNMCLLTYIHT